MASGFPKIVYKYRNWQESYHKNLLLKNELYLSSPKDLNDPFDCRIPHNYSLLDSDEKIELYAQQQAKKMIGYKGITKENFYELFDVILEKINKNPQVIQKEYEAILFNNQDLYYGVLSLTGVWNNILLWSHYSDNHKGFCVGFNESKLQNCGRFGRGGMLFIPKTIISPR